MSNETVVVASKLPMALDLQICKSRVERRQDRSTVWEETVYYKDGPVVTINGTAVRHAATQARARSGRSRRRSSAAPR